MSDAYAMASVTAVLRLRLKRHLVRAEVSNVLGNVEVSSVPPDTLFPAGGPEEKTQLNLYLYAVSANTGWMNEGMPVRSGSGERVAAPPLPLNLHYLLTAYGKAPYHPEILLGHAMQCLHEDPVLTREMIEATLSPNPPDPSLPEEVKVAGLAQQIELIKLAPERQTTEESARFWSSLQSSFRLSAGYMASVVLIESTASTKTALPVRTRGVTTIELATPRIESIVSSAGELVSIDATSTILIRGSRLRGSGTVVVLGEIEHTPAPEELGDEEIELMLSSLATMPRAGVRGVQVFHEESLGVPLVPHRVFSSNIGAFLMRPRVTIGPETETTQTIGGVVYVDGTLEVQFDPAVGRDQKVFLLLNEFQAPAGRSSRAYRFAAPKNNGITNTDPETATITFAFEEVIQGDYLLRVQVDGATSELGVDGQGAYATPQRSFG